MSPLWRDLMRGWCVAPSRAIILVISCGEWCAIIFKFCIVCTLERRLFENTLLLCVTKPDFEIYHDFTSPLVWAQLYCLSVTVTLQTAIMTDLLYSHDQMKGIAQLDWFSFLSLLTHCQCLDSSNLISKLWKWWLTCFLRMQVMYIFPQRNGHKSRRTDRDIFLRRRLHTQVKYIHVGG